MLWQNILMTPITSALQTYFVSFLSWKALLMTLIKNCKHWNMNENYSFVEATSIRSFHRVKLWERSCQENPNHLETEKSKRRKSPLRYSYTQNVNRLNLLFSFPHKSCLIFLHSPPDVNLEGKNETIYFYLKWARKKVTLE